MKIFCQLVSRSRRKNLDEPCRRQRRCISDALVTHYEWWIVVAKLWWRLYMCLEANKKIEKQILPTTTLTPPCVADLSDCQLMQVPDAVYHLMRNTQLTGCNLSGNVITKIPPKFAVSFSLITGEFCPLGRGGGGFQDVLWAVPKTELIKNDGPGKCLSIIGRFSLLSLRSELGATWGILTHQCRGWRK